MTVVPDASAVVAAVTSTAGDGPWARAWLQRGPLVAPHLMLVETANILRRLMLAGELTPQAAAAAHEDLLSLRVQFVPYAPYAERVFAMAGRVTAYDAWSVAVAVVHDACLVTLDRRLARGVDDMCRVHVPPIR